MTKSKNMILIWAPRVLLMIMILLFAILSLDVFSMEGPTINKIGGYLIQLIPAFCMVAILVVSWKRPLLGGWICLILSIIFTVFFKTYESIVTFLLITGTTAGCGVLFMYSNKQLNK